MDQLSKQRSELEKAGFYGETLENALNLIERTGAPQIMTKTLVKSVTKKGMTPSMALHTAETFLREKGFL